MEKSNNKSSQCWLGLHNSEVFREIDLTDLKGAVIGLIIVSKCKNCGKLKHTKIHTVERGYN